MKKFRAFKVGKVYLGGKGFKGLRFKVLRKKKNIVLIKRSDGFYELTKIDYVPEHTVYPNGTEVVYGGKEVFLNKTWKGIVSKDRNMLEEIFVMLKPSKSHPYN